MWKLLSSFVAVLTLSAAGSFLGCSRSEGPPGAAVDDRVHAAGPDRKVRLEFDSGPIGEVVFTHDTAGKLVVGGVCYFPDGTRLDVALVDSSGSIVARSQPTVEDAMFNSLPLSVPDTTGGPRDYVVHLSASFAPGAQSPEVLRKVKPGTEFVGEGMMVNRQGHLAYSRRLRVSL
jgi:hypothetical protein